MRVYYDRDADLNLIKGKKVVHRRLRQPGPRPCAEPEGFRRQGRRHRAAQGLGLGQEGGSRRLQGDGSRRGRQMGRPRDDADPRRIAGRHLPRASARQHEERRGAGVRPRPQRALQPARSARRSRRADDRAEGPRPHRALGIPARRRRALPDRDLQGLRRATPTTSASATPRRSAAAAPASSRPRSRKSARPICSASRSCSAAAWSN